MLVENVDLELNSLGIVTVAVDSVHAGVGDIVLVAREGRTASDVLGKKGIPVRSVIVGVIDHLDVDPSLSIQKESPE